MRTAYSTRPAQLALALLLVAAGCGTARLYEGAPRAPGEVATIVVGSTVVRAVDGAPRRGGAFDVETFELPPGPHQLTLVFELPARSIGIRALPAQQGIGTCVLAFETVAGHQYYLAARASDEMGGRWDGSWSAWVRDPTVAHEDDIIARCTALDPNAPPKHGKAAATGAAGTAGVPPARRDGPEPSSAPAAAEAPPAVPTAVTPPAGVAPVAPVAPTTPGPPLRLGTWNLRSFGRLPGKDLPRIANAIETHFDLLALTELSGDGGPAALQRLTSQLGRGWAALLGPAPHPPADEAGAEYTAILYRRDRVRPCADWERLRELPLDSGAAILRPPAVGCFAAAAPGRPGLDLLLAAYHATGGDGDAATVAEEAAHLDAVFAAMALARPGEVELIIAGDFNLDAAELATVSRAVAPSDAAGTTLDLLGNRTPRRTDQILFRDATATALAIGVATPLDLRGGSPQQYYRSISDRLPIVIQLRAPEADND